MTSSQWLTSASVVCPLSYTPIQNAKARLRVPGARADDLSECLLSLGAISVTVEDANAGTEAEQAIARGPANWLSMGSSSGEAMREQLWDASTLRFFFTPGEVGGEDGGASELVTMACDACGLSPVPAVEVTDDDCQVRSDGSDAGVTFLIPPVRSCRNPNPQMHYRKWLTWLAGGRLVAGCAGGCRRLRASDRRAAVLG